VIFRRQNKDEYEGWWKPVAGSPSPRLHGKIEWEPSLAGGTEIDLLVKDLDVPDGQEVDVVCDGTIVLRAAVTRGSVRAILRSSEGHSVPRLAEKAVELNHGGTVLARTVLEPD
jgi:hypothetical protein